MHTWQDVKEKKAEMRKQAVATLSNEEQEILMKALELEWENRHLKSPDIKQPLRNFVQQVIK